MTEAGYCRVLLDKKDTKITELESEITKLRMEYEKQIVKLQEENAELKEKYCVYTDGKTPDHSFISKEFPKESLEKLPHIKELYVDTKRESQIFRENLFLKYNLSKAKELLREIIDTPVFNQMGGELYENEGYTELVEEAEQFIKEEL